jgi:hypothetical protein
MQCLAGAYYSRGYGAIDSVEKVVCSVFGLPGTTGLVDVMDDAAALSQLRDMFFPTCNDGAELIGQLLGRNKKMDEVLREMEDWEEAAPALEPQSKKGCTTENEK